MEYIKYFEELDFFKKLSKSIKPSEIGREPIYNPKTKEEPIPEKPNPKQEIYTQTIKWLTDNKKKYHTF